MAFIKVLSLVTVLAAAVLAVPVYEKYQQVEEEHYEPAHYEFKYAVKDEHTHDIKEQYEKRDGDKVEGYYTLVEPDGTVRTVKYSSDKHTGFIAQVQKSGRAIHPPTENKVVVPVKKLVYPIKKVVYPVRYQSYEPVLQQSYTQEAPSYSGGEQSSKGANSYSNVSYGGASQEYGHAQ